MNARKTTFEMSVLEGSWPRDIAGHHWIMGLGPRLPCQNQYDHPPGVLHRFDLSPTPDGRLLWHARDLHTPDVKAALAHGEVLADPRARSVLGDSLTACNTGFFQIGERMFVTSDVNRPWELDPDPMDPCTVVGPAREWGGSSRLSMLSPWIPTSAHPFFDENDGLVYNYTYKQFPENGTSLSSFDRHLSITTWRGDGPLQLWEVPGAGLKQYVHEIFATRHFVVLLESSSFQRETGMYLLGLPRLAPHMPVSNLIVIRKSDLTEASRNTGVPFRKVTIPLEAFHMVVDYEDDGEHLDLWLAHANGLDMLLGNTAEDVHWKTGQRFRFSQLGAIGHADYTPLGRYRVHVEEGRVLESRRIVEPERFWGAGIWSWDARRKSFRDSSLYVSWFGFHPSIVSKRLMDLYGDRPHRILPPNTLPDRAFAPALTEIDWKKGEIVQSYVYPSHEMVTLGNEFIPRRGSEGGWLGVYLVTPRRNAEYWLFDAERLSAGPVARLGCRSLRPMQTVHHRFTHEAPPRKARYHVSVEDDLGTDWRHLPAPYRAVVEEAIRMDQR
ncbi:carotenoid oxygenase family protein [Sorangium sp. So ce269]